MKMPYRSNIPTPKTFQNGQALVEFALVLPILLLLVMGIIEFGRALYLKNTYSNAARSAARVAVVTANLRKTDYAAGSLSSRSATDAIQQKLYDSLSYLSSTDKNAAIASVAINPIPTPPPPTYTAISNDTITVKVSVPFNTLVPKLLQWLRPGGNSITLVGEASMRYE